MTIMLKGQQKILLEFQDTLNLSFHDLRVLMAALTHRSYLAEGRHREGEDNQRLEWLGDTVLGMVIAEHLFYQLPESKEGMLSKYKARLVSKNSLARFARVIDIGKYLFLGKGEDDAGGRKRDSILSDAVESLIAAVYLDQGFDQARDFILQHHRTEIESVLKKKQFGDHKSMLQEFLQKRGWDIPQYDLIVQSGPDHRKIFTVSVTVMGREYRGTGYSKKEAEQMAAWVTLEDLKDDGV